MRSFTAESDKLWLVAPLSADHIHPLADYVHHSGVRYDAAATASIVINLITQKNIHKPINNIYTKESNVHQVSWAPHVSHRLNQESETSRAQMSHIYQTMK